MTGTSQVMHDDVINERFVRVWDRFGALERMAQERSASEALALAKAEQSLADYKVNSNEFRGALSDMAARLLPREEYDTRHVMLVDKVNSLDARVLQNTAAQTGRSSGISAVGYVTLSLIAALVGLSSITNVIVTLLHK